MGRILRGSAKLTDGDSRWIPVRQVRDLLVEAGLYNSETPHTLIVRAIAGLLPIKARRLTYDTPPRGGSSHDDFVLPVAMMEGLKFAQLNIDDRTIKSHSVRIGQRSPMTNFIAFDVELDRAALMDFIGPISEKLPKDAPQFSGRFLPFLEEMHRLITEDGVSQRQASLSCAEMDGIDLITYGSVESRASMLRTAYKSAMSK